MRRVLSIGAIAGLSLVLLSSGALASCAAPPPMREAIDGSAATFVGTVSEVENYRRWATVDVTEIWMGEVHPGVVVVKGGPKDPSGPSHVATSIDRSYRVGVTYLFVVHAGRGSVFRDNICSSTTRFVPALESFRPLSATGSPLPGATTPGGEQTEGTERIDVAIPLGGAAIAIAVGTMIWLLRRRK